MSMVTVHGPNTMYTDAPGVIKDPTGTVTSTQSPTNGLVFTCQAVGARPAGDYAWTASASGVCAPTSGPGPVTVTFPAGAAGANQTITCTVSGAGTPPPANAAYAVTVKPVTGQPKMDEAGEPAAMEAAAPTSVEPPTGNGEYEEYDPGAFTVNEVVAEATDANDPDYTRALIEAERAGKNRVTLISHLEDILAEQC